MDMEEILTKAKRRLTRIFSSPIAKRFMAAKDKKTSTAFHHSTFHHNIPRRGIFHHSKGQMFIIAAIFMIIGFILLKGLLSLPELTQEKTFQDTSYLDRNLKNIKSEYAYIASVAAMQADANKTAKEYMYSFSRYVRSEFDSRIFYVFIFSNGSTNNFSVTVGNFLKDNISGRVNFTSSTPPGRIFALNDSGNTTLEFNSTAAWISVTLNYTVQNRDTAEAFYFNSSAKNYAAAFFDVSLQERGFFVRSKSTYNRTW